MPQRLDTPHRRSNQSGYQAHFVHRRSTRQSGFHCKLSLTKLSQLVSHLAERLSGDGDGTSKIFWDSAVDHLNEFFERFQRLNIRSNAERDRLDAEARRIMRGVRPQTLRDQEPLRERVAGGLSQVEASLDQWLMDRPQRSILRRSR